MSGRAYREDRERSVDVDKSDYPQHVPTIREQAESAGWDLDDVDNRNDVDQLTAIGELVDPFALRAHLEEYYEADTARERTEKWSHERSGDPGFTTMAHEKGPDHPDTSYPSNHD